MSRAPISSGTRKLPNPKSIGVANRKIIAVPCMVKSWLYSCGESSRASGRASWVRIASALRPARAKNSPAVTR